MKKMCILAILLALFTLGARPAFANSAQVMLIPTRIVMDKGDRYTTVVIKNVGNATGNMSVDLIDMSMDATGAVLESPTGQDPYSAIPLLRISPRSVTLKPGDSQNVRLLLRKPEGLAAGEYRSHLKVRVDEDNVEAKEAEKASGQSGMSVSVKAKLALTIPVIIRVGETVVTTKIQDLKLVRDEKGKPSLDMTLLRTGNRSVMGDFTVNRIDASGKTELIRSFPGVPVYRSTERRHTVVPLDDIPPGTDLSSGKLQVIYTAQEKEGGMKLDEAMLDLSAR